MQYARMIVVIVGGCASALGGAEPSRTVAESTSGIVVHEGLVYAKPGEALTLDLYIPASTGEAVPCVIVIQGGGFSSQDGKRFRSFAEYLAGHGFAAATIAYRGRPNHTYEDTMADARAAVRYVRQVSGEYGIDPDRIGAMGRSAGATLAALLAVTGEMEEPVGEGGEPAHSSRIQAAVGFAGVYDFVARFTDSGQIALQPRVETKRQTNGEWIGEPFAATSKAWRNASAVNHLDAADPPMLLIHCKDDETVPWPQSQDMHARMIDAGIDSEIEIYETGGHGCQTKDAADSLARMVAFFQKALMEPSALHNSQ